MLCLSFSTFPNSFIQKLKEISLKSGNMFSATFFNLSTNIVNVLESFLQEALWWWKQTFELRRPCSKIDQSLYTIWLSFFFPLQMDWSFNIGEHAVDIFVFSSSNAPLSIFILGERSLFCLTDTGSIRFMKKFEYNPSCFLPYNSGKEYHFTIEWVQKWWQIKLIILLFLW